MKKVKVYMEEHRILSAVFSISLVIFILMSIVWIVKKIFAWTRNGINLLIGFIGEFAYSRECRRVIVDTYNVTQFKILNVLFFYVTLCLVYVIVLFVLKVIIIMLGECIEGCINKIDSLILGKKHQKSLKYTGITLWYIKCKADVLFFLDWIRRDILNARYMLGEEYTLIKWVRMFSLENVIVVLKNVLRFFFDLTPTHLILGGISIYTYFESNLIAAYNNLKEVMMQREITLTYCIDFFETLIILCLLIYIVFDVRHKASGYSNLRAKRFEELVQLEESLLNILCEIRYSLKKNIRWITEHKHSILSNGAYELSGKECHFRDTEIVFDDNNFGDIHFRNPMYIFSGLKDMEDEFQKLSELEEKLKKSSLNHSNIYLVDHKAMLTHVVHFWSPGIDDKDYMKMQFFCKSSMEKWYKNNFVEPTENINGEKRYYSKQDTITKILQESSMLDYEVSRAFELELYMKRYERKMIKRFKRINNFSRFNLN